MKKKKRKQETKQEFSKRLVILIVRVSLIYMGFPFVLAFMGKEQIAEKLAIVIASEIVGVVITYSVKAFWGKFYEVKTEIKEKDKKYDRENNTIHLIDLDNEDEGGIG